MAAGDVRQAEREAAQLQVGRVHSHEYLSDLEVRIRPSSSSSRLDAAAPASQVTNFRHALDLERAIVSTTSKPMGVVSSGTPLSPWQTMCMACD